LLTGMVFFLRSPRSSVDRAVASEAMAAGSIPVGDILPQGVELLAGSYTAHVPLPRCQAAYDSGCAAASDGSGSVGLSLSEAGPGKSSRQGIDAGLPMSWR
jgi:hypothetical protein